MSISSDTRGNVAGSSFGANGNSRSRTSGLKPPAAPVAMLNCNWKLLLAVRIGLISSSGLSRYKSVCERTGPSVQRER